MITVLVAEDDLLTRIGISSMLKDNQDSIAVVGEASNGKEALTMIRQLHPDIVLTDVQMPVMNGIDLIREAKKEPNSPQFVILSAYNDYEYVRQGMLLGADDYLLKLELKKDALLSRLVQIHDAAAKKAPGESEQKENQRDTYEKERCIYDLLTGNRPAELSAADCLNRCGIAIPEKDLVCVIIKCDVQQQYAPVDTEAPQRVFRTILDLTGNYGPSYGCMLSISLFGFVISLSEPNGLSAVSDIRKRICGDLSEYGKNALNIPMTVLASELLSDFDDLPAFFRENCAYDSGSYQLLQSGGAGDSGTPYTEDLTAIDEAVRRDDSRLAAAFGGLLKTLRANGEKSPRSLHGVCYVLLYLTDQYYQAHPGINEHWRRSDAMLKLNRTCHRSEDYLAFIEEIRDSLLGSIESAGADHSAVRRAEQYIQQNYQSDIPLDEIAGQVGLAPAYFSRLFSKTTGCSYVNYLKNTRIAKARDLLSTTDEKIQTIGEQVGYPNFYYFCRIFKRSAGMSPTQYRRHSRRQNP